MSVQLLSIEGSQVKIEVTIDLSRSMLTSEENIQEILNDVGCIATEAALKYLDTDGSAIEIAGEVMRTKGEQPKAYQTPYGEVVVKRHVYQRSGGGKTYCPLEREARIIITSTPLFAKQVSSKLAYGSAREVQRDLGENHSRPVAVSYIQHVSEAVATIIETKEESWNYVPPRLEVEIASVAIGLDGTCMLLCDTGWREAMVGTISLYDALGERAHTIYIGATPEYGKASFLERLEREIQSAPKPVIPKRPILGLRMGLPQTGNFSKVIPVSRCLISIMPRVIWVRLRLRFTPTTYSSSSNGLSRVVINSSMIQEPLRNSTTRCLSYPSLKNTPKPFKITSLRL